MDERARTTSAWRASVVGRTRRSTTGSRSLHQSSVDTDDETTRNVRFSDQRLATMASEAAGSIRWDALRKPHLSSRWSRKKSPNGGSSSGGGGGGAVNGGGIAVYTREDPQSFSVLAKALLQCGVQELRLVFDTRTSDQFSDIMRTLSPKDFLAGELVHIVSSNNLPDMPAGGPHSRSSRVGSTYSDSSSVRTTASDVAADLVVSAVTFEKANVFARNEEWCFLEYLQDNASIAARSSTSTNSSSNESLSVNKKPWFAKTLLSLHPDDCFFGRVAQRAKHGHDVLAGFYFEEEQDGRSTRVTFTGEMFYSGGSDSNKHSNSKDSASNRVVRARLLKMAQWIDRLANVVRRRRLGIQVLADRRQIKVLNSHCVCCRRSFLMARKKSCALCGYHVCERCSGVEQRETCASIYERSAIESIRVCDTCIVRVDQCRYAHVTKRALRPARVVPDVFEASSRVSGSAAAMRSRATTGIVLTNLLQETMINASAARKKSALSVIRYLVDQEDSDAYSDTGSTGTNASSQQQRHPHHRKITLTEASADAQYFAALQTRLNDRPLPVDQCVLANNEKRSYAIEYPTELGQVIATPIPANEAARLQLIKDEHLVSKSTAEDAEDGALEPVPELDIICAIASKELRCSGSLITIVDKDHMRVIASTIASFASKSFPRDQGFCTQTILSDKPLLVPHPEADVRFAHIIPVKHMNVSFYCGFPLLAADKATVIGSVCCVDHESRELTQSQYTVMTKLAETASRVVQMQAKTHKHAAVNGSKA